MDSGKPCRVFVQSFGCQMNVYDSERMVEMLAPRWEVSSSAEAADLVILNTCHIREKASEKVYSALGRLRNLQRAKAERGQAMRLMVAGCVAQAEGEEISRRAPYVSAVFGPQSVHRLPEFVAKAFAEDGVREPMTALDFAVEAKFDMLAEQRQTGGRKPCAFVTIQEGCDRFCSFCVVPYTRGAEQGRPVAAVCQEVEQLVAGGTREVTLLGQNVNGYRGPGPEGELWSLAQLLHRLADIEGLERLRFTTSHPWDMTDELIAAFGSIPALMPYLHLPVQSGSDKILKAMNRRHTVEDYCNIVHKLRQVRPDIALSSDFIVGFPGESDEDFAATLKLVRTVGFASAYSFRYSPRPGTPAASLTPVDPEVQLRRLQGLQQLLEAQQSAFSAATVGQTLPILLERPGRHAGQIMGRSPYLQPVHVTAETAQLGELMMCQITDWCAHSLMGTLVPRAA